MNLKFESSAGYIESTLQLATSNYVKHKVTQLYP